MYVLNRIAIFDKYVLISAIEKGINERMDSK